MRFLRRLRSFDADLDFRRGFRWGLAISGLLVLISVASLLIQGLNLGIDFEGGTSWEVTAPGVSVTQARDDLAAIGQEGAVIQALGDDNLRVEAEPLGPAARDRVTARLADLAGVPANDVSVSTIGPSWGNEVSRQALEALIAFFVVVTAYISFRLEWRMAVGAMAAVVHDILISVGVYSLFQFQVTPGTVIAFLTILGFSLYDTMVVFDKLKENSKGPAGRRRSYSDTLNLSLNQTIMRSLNTSITSLLPVLAILIIGSQILGAVTLREFGLALLVGLLVGVYSSIFVASPVVLLLKGAGRPGRSATVTGPTGETFEAEGAQDETRASTPREPVGAPTTGTPSSGSAKPAAKPRAGSPYSANHPPRPRKKGKRR